MSGTTEFSISCGKNGDEEVRDWHQGTGAASSVDNLLWQFIPVRAYSNAERKLATSGGTPLLVSLENMNTEPKVGGGSKTASHGQSRRPWTTLGFLVSRATLSSAPNLGFELC